MAGVMGLTGLTACRSDAAPPGPSSSPDHPPAQNSTPPAAAPSVPLSNHYFPISDPIYGRYRFAPDAPGIGQAAPDFELPTVDGETFSLSGTLASAPVVLIFYRGFW